MTEFASGGSSSIYQDADPINVTMGTSETLTVPSDETWVVTIYWYCIASDGKGRLDGSTVTFLGRDQTDKSAVVVGGGRTVGTNFNMNASITGWKL